MNFKVALVVSITFFLIKFVEMRMIKKEMVPVSEMCRESIYVFLSFLVAEFIIEQVDTNDKLIRGGENANVFIGSPNF